MGHAEAAVELGPWNALRTEAIAVRHAVFVAEQLVPEDLEVDDFDPVSVHALARDVDGAAIGTGRLLPDGHIGRLAVLARARGRGVGSALLRALMDESRRRGNREAMLNAQVQAVPFYERYGYAAEGEPYDDAGIAHIAMRCRL
ncbi:MAG TPA: GNAT family N-acetyltransferase [Burkholderiaceae bacterium]|nr:GNAT family N-acetyltransferase [Burkholderiaceae bacterium]